VSKVGEDHYERQGQYAEAEPLYLRAATLSQESLGAEHPQTRQIKMNYLTILSHKYTNGDVNALLRLLTQKKQDDYTNGESS